jgi:hypothetical protein
MPRRRCSNVHAGEPSADDHRIEYADLFQLGPLIRHVFSDVLWWPGGKAGQSGKG